MNESERTSSAWTFGRGWGRRERFAGEEFRWVAGHADFFVATLRRLEYRVDVLAEPGPGIRNLPCRVEFHDLENASCVYATSLAARRRIAFALPAGPPKIHHLRAGTPDGGASHDGRVLDFRVFTIDVRPIPGDVVPPAAGFLLGKNWGRQEIFGGECFRWIDNDAVIEVESGATFPLVLDVEGGPGLGPDARVQILDDASGAPLLDMDLSGRRECAIPSAPRAGPCTLRLHVIGGGHVDAADPRVLNLRVFDSPSEPE